MATMNLTEYAKHKGISLKTAQRWFHNGTLPDPAEKVGRLILVEVPDATGRHPSSHPAPRDPRTAIYLTADSRSTPAEIKRWALEHGIRVDDALCPHDAERSETYLRQLLADPTVTRIITDTHPAADLISAALSAHGREFITTQPSQPQQAPTINAFKPRLATTAGA